MKTALSKSLLAGSVLCGVLSGATSSYARPGDVLKLSNAFSKCTKFNGPICVNGHLTESRVIADISPVVSADGSTVAFAQSLYSEPDASSIYGIGSLEIRKLSRTNGVVSIAPKGSFSSATFPLQETNYYEYVSTRPSLSYNGNVVAYDFGERGVRVVSFNGETWKEIFKALPDDSGTPSQENVYKATKGIVLSPDGNSASYISLRVTYNNETREQKSESTLLSVDLSTGNRRVLVKFPFEAVLSGVTTDGNRFLLAGPYESDSSGYGDVYVWQIGQASPSILLPQDPTTGNAPTMTSWDSTGKVLAYASSQDYLVRGDTNKALDVFLTSLSPAKTRRLSISSSGDQANFSSALPAISANGAFVSFASKADNLRRGDTNYSMDVYLYDAGRSVLIAPVRGLNGAQSNGDSKRSGIDAKGNTLAFWSEASNLVTGDTNKLADIFVVDAPSAIAPSTPPVMCSPSPAPAR